MHSAQMGQLLFCDLCGIRFGALAAGLGQIGANPLLKGLPGNVWELDGDSFGSMFETCTETQSVHTQGAGKQRLGWESPFE